MKIVDVLGVKLFQDGERIIMQVNFTVALKSSSLKCMNVIGHQHSVIYFKDYTFQTKGWFQR